MTPAEPSPPSSRTWLRRLPILVILAAALIGAIAFRDALSFESLARHRETLLAFRRAGASGVLTYHALHAARLLSK